MIGSKAERRATKVLDEMGVSAAPVAVEDVARHLGAQIVYRPFEGGVSGMVYRDRTEKVIGVNSSHAKTRQRFTVAHEIGHLVLHQGKKVFVDSFEGRINWRDGAWDPREAEANAFAAELLMPAEFVSEEVSRAVTEEPELPPVQLVAELAKAFRVSRQAMQIRLESLGILDPGGLLG